MLESKLFTDYIEGTIGDSGRYIPGTQLNRDLKDPTAVPLITKTRSLSSLQEDFELFTYAPIMNIAKLEQDPVIEFVVRRNIKKGLIGFVLSQRPIFAGISPVGSNQQSNY